MIENETDLCESTVEESAQLDSWGLEGFLDIFLRNGSVADVLPKSLSLIILGVVMLILTMSLLRRQREV